MAHDPLDTQHSQLQAWYDRLTNRLAALDKDIGRALSEFERVIQHERRAEVATDRDTVVAYLEALERNKPLPGPWPPRFGAALSYLPYYEELIQAIVYEGRTSISGRVLLQACHNQVRRALEDIDQKYNPDLYVHRAVEAELANFFVTPTPDQSHNCYLLVAPAGSGKTNLLASLASRYVERQPVLLILGGSVYLSATDGLVGSIQTELETASPNIAFHSAGDSLHTLDRLAHEAGRDVLIFIDAINEHDHPALMRKALEDLLSKTRRRRIKLVVTCRDYYWGLFKGRFWELAVVNALPSGMAESTGFNLFTKDEHRHALDLYLRHYHITGVLGDRALEHLRHPLLLLFFCEAYREQRVDLREDVRLKELFDQYWNNKIKSIADRMLRQGVERHIDFLETDTQGYLLALASYMLHHNVRAVPLSSLSLATGSQQQLGDPSSNYFRIRDEYIILEERERNSGFQTTVQVAFVYEAFMEYAMAKALIHEWRNRGFEQEQILEQVEWLTRKYGEFAKILGVMVYLALMLEEEMDIHLWPVLINRGKMWQGVVFEAIRKLPESQIDDGIHGFFFDLLTSEDNAIKRQALETLKLKRLVQHAPTGLVEELAHLAVDRRRSISGPARIALANAPVQPAIPVLISYLSQSDNYSVKHAQKALVRIGEPAVDPLIAILAAEDVGTRRAAVRTLRELRADRSDEALVSVLRDDDLEVRRGATKALGDIWRLPELVRLGSSHAKTRAEAAKAVAGRCDPRTSAPLAAALLLDEDASVREEIVRTFQKCRFSQTIQALIAAIDDPNIDVRRQAVDALGASGDTTALQVLRTMGNIDDPVTQFIVLAAQLSLGDLSAVDKIDELLNASEDYDQALVVNSLQVRYGNEIDAVTKIIDAPVEPMDIPTSLLQDSADQTRELSEGVYLGVPGSGKTHLALLAALIAHEARASKAHGTRVKKTDPQNANTSASNVLLNAGHYLTIAVNTRWGEPLKQFDALNLLTDIYTDIRSPAVNRLLNLCCLAHLRSNMIPLSKQKQIEGCWEVLVEERRVVATEVIGLLNAPDAVKSLKLSLTDQSENVRLAGLDALAILNGPDKLTAVLGMVDDPSPIVRCTALDVLGDLGDAQAEPTILAALQDSNPCIRRSALRAMGMIRHWETLVGLASEVQKLHACTVSKLLPRDGIYDLLSLVTSIVPAPHKMLSDAYLVTDISAALWDPTRSIAVESIAALAAQIELTDTLFIDDAIRLLNDYPGLSFGRVQIAGNEFHPPESTNLSWRQRRRQATLDAVKLTIQPTKQLRTLEVLIHDPHPYVALSANRSLRRLGLAVRDSTEPA